MEFEFELEFEFEFEQEEEDEELQRPEGDRQGLQKVRCGSLMFASPEEGTTE